MTVNDARARPAGMSPGRILGRDVVCDIGLEQPFELHFVAQAVQEQVPV